MREPLDVVENRASPTYMVLRPTANLDGKHAYVAWIFYMTINDLISAPLMARLALVAGRLPATDLRRSPLRQTKCNSNYMHERDRRR